MGLPSWDVTPGSRVQSQAEPTCVNRFHYLVRLTSLSDDTLKPRSLVPEIVYRVSERSHGTLINPGSQVWCQWKLTWSYKQSTPHHTWTASGIDKPDAPLRKSAKSSAESCSDDDDALTFLQQFRQLRPEFERVAFGLRPFIQILVEVSALRLGHWTSS